MIGTDGSELALAAAERARGIVDLDDVVVVAVVPPMVAGELPVAAAPIAAGAAAQRATREVHDEAARHAEEVAARFAPVATSRVVDGDPGPTLCQVAAEEAADVLVVGSHGRGWLQRVLLGSVSTYVVHHATCPVLVVRPTARR